MPADAPCQLNVPLHDRDPFRMNCTEIRVLKKVHKESLGRFLQCKDRRALPPQPDGTRTRRIICFDEFICHLADNARERQFRDQQIGRALVFTNFA